MANTLFHKEATASQFSKRTRNSGIQISVRGSRTIFCSGKYEVKVEETLALDDLDSRHPTSLPTKQRQFSGSLKDVCIAVAASKDEFIRTARHEVEECIDKVRKAIRDPIDIYTG